MCDTVKEKIKSDSCLREEVFNHLLLLLLLELTGYTEVSGLLIPSGQCTCLPTGSCQHSSGPYVDISYSPIFYGSRPIIPCLWDQPAYMPAMNILVCNPWVLAGCWLTSSNSVVPRRLWPLCQRRKRGGKRKMQPHYDAPV